MRLNRLDLNLLIVLDALLIEKNITKAAKNLHLSQPATSSALARLRDYFDDKLLVRVGVNMLLTPLAESLIHPVHTILMTIQATVEKRPDFDEGSSDRLFNFMLSDYNSTVFMPQVIAKIKKIAPNVRFKLNPTLKNPVDNIEQGYIDFLLMPKESLSKHHPYDSLFSDSYVCVTCASNTLVKDNLTLELFLSLGYISVCFEGNIISHIDSVLTNEYNLVLKQEVVLNNFSQVPHYLLNTNRIAIVHQKVAEQWAVYLPLKIIPTPIPLAKTEWCLQWHELRDHDLGCQWLRNVIKNLAEH